MRLQSEGLPSLSITRDGPKPARETRTDPNDKSPSPRSNDKLSSPRHTSDKPTPRDSKDRISVPQNGAVRASKSFESIKRAPPDTKPKLTVVEDTVAQKPPRKETTESAPVASASPPAAGEEGKKKYHTIDLVDPSKPKPADLIVSRRRGIASVKMPTTPMLEDDPPKYESKRKEKKPSFNTDRIVPPFLLYLVEAIEETLLTKGLYRVSALEKDISELRSILIEGMAHGNAWYRTHVDSWG